MNTRDTARHLAIGTLQDTLNWLSGGKHFHVEEIECTALGRSSTLDCDR